MTTGSVAPVLSLAPVLIVGTDLVFGWRRTVVCSTRRLEENVEQLGCNAVAPVCLNQTEGGCLVWSQINHLDPKGCMSSGVVSFPPSTFVWRWSLSVVLGSFFPTCTPLHVGGRFGGERCHAACAGAFAHIQ
ncbi:unnamed protein product, partial [Ectocarpus sp. 12 AP-2014]